VYLVKVVLFDSHVQEPKPLALYGNALLRCDDFFLLCRLFFFVSLVYCLSLYVVITYLYVQ